MQVGALLQGRERGVATTYSGSDDLLLLPVDIGNLLNLVELKVEQNQLTSVPASIYGCGKLKVLWLSDNNIVSMEPLVALTQLEVLKLRSPGTPYGALNRLGPERHMECRHMECRQATGARLCARPSPIPTLTLANINLKPPQPQSHPQPQSQAPQPTPGPPTH